MAVTGVNNYSNIYTNAYTGNIRKIMLRKPQKSRLWSKQKM